MQLEYYNYPKSDSVIFKYCETLKDNKDVCSICHMIEDNGQQWDRYVLPCGDIAHTRCLRKFLDSVDGLHCPNCGKLEESQESKYCFTCHMTGHDYGNDCNNFKVTRTQTYDYHRRKENDTLDEDSEDEESEDEEDNEYNGMISVPREKYIEIIEELNIYRKMFNKRQIDNIYLGEEISS